MENVEDDPDIKTLQLRVGIPQHVVYRDFVSETVLLNIQTGQYHGLNPTAGRMLTVLDKVASVDEAATQLAQASSSSRSSAIQRDLSTLCEGLLERGLLEIRASDGWRRGDRAAPAARWRRPWRSRAFGMDLDLGFRTPGASPRGGAVEPPTRPRVDLVYADSIDRAWPPRRPPATGRDGPTRTAGDGGRRAPHGRLPHHAAPVRPLPRRAPTGASVACAPPAVGWWYWQRLLIGQVLPAAAALRGYEVLHASAVAIGGRVDRVCRRAGTGQVVARAAADAARRDPLVAEDVLAIARARRDAASPSRARRCSTCARRSGRWSASGELGRARRDGRDAATARCT